MVQVMDHGIEVDLKHRLMGFPLQYIADPFKFKQACSFQEYRFILEGRKRVMHQEIIGGMVEALRHMKLIRIFVHVPSYPDEFIDPFASKQSRDLPV